MYPDPTVTMSTQTTSEKEQTKLSEAIPSQKRQYNDPWPPGTLLSSNYVNNIAYIYTHIDNYREKIQKWYNTGTSLGFNGRGIKIVFCLLMC